MTQSTAIHGEKVSLLRVLGPGHVWALGVGIVLLFNTASIFAMIRHYSGDKEHIYGLDIHYLDALRGTA